MDNTTTKTTGHDECSFKIASLNCWGLIYSPKRKPRLAHIQKYLLEPTSDFDFVTLQEVWMRTDYRRLKEALKDRYPFTIYFPCGVIGSGLAIFSRHPICQSFFKRYTLNGSIDRVWHGDYFSGKGVGGIRVRLPGCTLDLYTTHLHAEYNPEKLGYTAHRLSQLQELSQFVEHTSRPTHVAIVTGDLNTTPDDFPYQMMIANGCGNRLDAPLRDAWLELYGTIQDTTGTTGTTGITGTTGNTGDFEPNSGYTYNLPTSTHYIKKYPSQRLDYILYAPRAGVRCNSVDLLTADTPYDPKMSLSDHLLIKTDFTIDCTQLATSKYPEETCPLTIKEEKEMALRALEIFSKKRARVIKWQQFYLWVAILMIVIFLALTITTAITIPNDTLTPLLTLTLFGIQPAVLVTAFSCFFLSRLFLQEERAALNHFIAEWEGWMIYNELTNPTTVDIVIKAE